MYETSGMLTPGMILAGSVSPLRENCASMLGELGSLVCFSANPCRLLSVPLWFANPRLHYCGPLSAWDGQIGVVLAYDLFMALLRGFTYFRNASVQLRAYTGPSGAFSAAAAMNESCVATDRIPRPGGLGT